MYSWTKTVLLMVSVHTAFGSAIIDDVFIDIKQPQYSREKSYALPGTVVSFAYPEFLAGSTVKCHVQATSDNINIALYLNDKEIEAISEEPKWDPAWMFRRLVTLHKGTDLFIPSGLDHSQNLTCQAWTKESDAPPERKSMFVNLNVTAPPVAMCSITTESFNERRLLITCTVISHPRLTGAHWRLPGLDSEYNEFNGFGKGDGENVNLSNKNVSSTKAILKLIYSCSSLTDGQQAALTVINRLGTSEIPQIIDCIKLQDTTTTTTTTATTTTTTTTTASTTTLKLLSASTTSTDESSHVNHVEGNRPIKVASGRNGSYMVENLLNVSLVVTIITMVV